ncbi:hypothetical protein F5144DRAFT_595665 [Chaetomium tenue]|uniref:Uncharacterized protein n=1 Tax=Chaetomium tenue TaxID=1854479 RepID=A0ACB7NZH3_9PEZI|nr:hypothetical protein F5144DRAFT_595665 [Chaetomium globosum]
MRTPRLLLLALASFSAAVLAEDTTFIRGHLSGPVGSEYPGNLNLAALERYPLPGPQCGSWVGVEVIFMVEVTEVCPEGSTVTETLTQCVETLTRSICATETTNRPCYPCIMGTPPPSDTATVTVTSCATATDETMTVTVQLCGTCTTTTYVGTIPGYTPGGPCHGCSPYSSGAPSSSCSEEVTTTTTSTSTSTVSASACDESGVSSTATTTPPDNPFSSSTTSATNTPYQPTTTGAPPAVTAGGVRIGAVGFAVQVKCLCLCVSDKMCAKFTLPNNRAPISGPRG